MRPETRKYLHDIRRAASLIVRFTHGKSYAEYEIDELLQAAVEREFEIIGEAMSRLAAGDPETAEQFTAYRRIISFRNILIHGYADVDNRLVWNVVETNLPTLVREVEGLLTTG